MERISACIIVRNEEKNIRDCLESVKWADEIVVVDAFSEDGTVSICKEYTDRVFEREWTGFYDQVSFVVAAARNPWILYIEADERISPELYEEIRREFSAERVEWDGFSVPRLSQFLGGWI
ncbi:MAG: glycosyltransferase family 2 protein, partial [Deltaproteobacteria bacterium]|nr:glycosyltransferase family 2 protein [Deltaproteobacteria bacterium]